MSRAVKVRGLDGPAIVRSSIAAALRGIGSGVAPPTRHLIVASLGRARHAWSLGRIRRN